jgi:hypothetical protein
MVAVRQTSTTCRLEFCTSASAAKGNIEKAYQQKMLVMHNTIRASLENGDATGVWRPLGTSEVFKNLDVDILYLWR